MHKVFLMSVIVAALVIPWSASKLRDPRRGVERVAVSMLIFVALWAFCVKFIVMRIIVIPVLEQ